MNRWHVIYQNPETARPDAERLDFGLGVAGEEGLSEARRRLFAKLRAEVPDDRVIRAMEAVPRELFVPPEAFHLAYEDHPLAIGEGQTISQPLIVAMMTSALDLKPGDTVLEIGTGSGYQAAVLARLAKHVVSVERKQGLLESARRRLHTLGIENVELHRAAGKLGWPEGTPYQAIVVTAASPRVPDGLVRQLDEGGRLVIPSGSKVQQELLKGTRRGGRLMMEDLGPCGFVPLIGEEAWAEE